MSKIELQELFFQTMYRFRTMHFKKLLPEDISQMEFFVLETISCLEKRYPQAEGCNVSRITEEMHISAPALSRLLKQLEVRGWVIRETDPGNRRNILVKATEAGKCKREGIEDIMHQCLDAVFLRMGEENIKTMLDRMREFSDCMELEIKERKKERKENG